MNATLLPDLKPGSDEWMTRMTASKVSAVLGLSPWESRFSLWHRMAGLLPKQPDTDQTRRGHYLEDAVARWWSDQNAGSLLKHGRAWSHESRDWQAASPDRLIYYPTAQPDTDYGVLGEPAALLEVKTTAVDDEWGDAGTDQIPPYYRCQVMWQLDTLSLPVAYVAVLLPRLEFREYRIDYNADEAAYLRAECRAFLDSLPGGSAQQRPNLDGHAQTYVTVRALNPAIDGDIETPAPLAREYVAAVKGLRAATTRHDLARVQMADHMQAARRALWDGKSIATRRAGRNGAAPFVQASTNLPDFEESA